MNSPPGDSVPEVDDRVTLLHAIYTNITLCYYCCMLIRIPLKFWRRHRRMTQGQLAIKAGLSQEAVSQIETGRRTPSLHTLMRLSDALGTTPNLLLAVPIQTLPLPDRHTIDQIARHIVDGIPSTSPLIRDIARLISQKLAAHKVKGRRLTVGSRWETKSRSVDVRQEYGSGVVKAILARVDKLL